HNAPLQVSDQRPRRDWAGRPDCHPRHVHGRGRAGGLHALVRDKGKVIDDGTVARLRENSYRWTAAEPNLRWFHQNASGLQVQIEDVSERLAVLAVQGPTSAGLLRRVADADIDNPRWRRCQPVAR